MVPLPEVSLVRCRIPRRHPFLEGTSVFVRVDDVFQWTDRLEHVLEIVLAAKAAACLQVVPGLVSAQTVDGVRRLKLQHNESISINQHGYRHANHGAAVEYEFGHGRPFEVQRREIAIGQAVLRSHFHDQVFMAFSPPYGAFDVATLRACEELGFRVFSQERCHYGISTSLMDFSVNLDLLASYDPPAGRPAEELLHEWSRLSFPGALVGVLVHPELMDDCDLNALATLVDAMSSDAKVRFDTFESMWEKVAVGRSLV